jgi:uncharacterized protein (DUF1501 family)
MDRRLFLKSSGIGLASFGFMAAAPEFLHQFASAQSKNGYGKKKVLVTIFQRGAVDGLNMIVPHGDSEYYDLRRQIAIPQPGKANGAIDLDGRFGFHPSLKPLETFWKDKKLAVITAVGSPDTNRRSHFDAQDYMESGTPGVKSTRDGWLNRTLQSTSTKDESPFRAVSMTQALPRSLYGRAPSVAMTNLSDFSIKAGLYTKDLKGGFEGIYQQNAKDSLGSVGKETFEAVDFLKRADLTQYKPENGAVYPTTPFGRNLQQIAQLIKANIGLEVAFTDTPGLNWDTHLNQSAGQNPSQGQLANLLRDFGMAIAAFATDLGRRMDDVVLLTMSEFGRTARENGSRGTDHGHANSMLVLGNTVKGGKVYGDFRGLRSDQLFEGRDLALTTDFRDVFAEAAFKHLGAKDLNKLFPNYAVSASKFRGFLS